MLKSLDHLSFMVSATANRGPTQEAAQTSLSRGGHHWSRSWNLKSAGRPSLVDFSSSASCQLHSFVTDGFGASLARVAQPSEDCLSPASPALQFSTATALTSVLLMRWQDLRAALTPCLFAENDIFTSLQVSRTERGEGGSCGRLAVRAEKRRRSLPAEKGQNLKRLEEIVFRPQKPLSLARM